MCRPHETEQLSAATHRLDEPVSKITVKGCCGVPIVTSMKYCVPCLLTMGIRSTSASIIMWLAG